MDADYVSWNLSACLLLPQDLRDMLSRHKIYTGRGEIDCVGCFVCLSDLLVDTLLSLETGELERRGFTQEQALQVMECVLSWYAGLEYNIHNVFEELPKVAAIDTGQTE
jgi:hypothetical protein